jgi:WD40 repeat protein
MSLDVSLDGKAVFVGSALGVFRVYDVSNRKVPRLVKQFKFYDDELPITGINSSPDGKFLVVTSSKSNKVFFMSQKANENFNVLGHAFVNGHVISCALTLYENQIYALCLLSNNVV